MRLEGSCHCGKVRFRCDSGQPYPYQRCYCSICRKTQGGGGYAINLSGDAATLKVRGAKHLKVYNARLREPGQRTRQSPAQRHFCGECGSALWLFDPRWPELVHPFASAIDTDLPVPPEHTHLLLGCKASWVEPCFAKGDRRHKGHPKESIAEWHARLGLETA
ncbi:GFA family protein [Falsiroseomonas tokyonensis]|uniref:GFA family protein n=1 Tax=Falsiroseomonas tokyonensis TaxID=430521 RepID=A0ABV7BNN6_9PROT|nr:GFA family protein [Falsiroseomonas tokyonensis]MBU8537148.1 GFA family protein [Falsiroseomonas tokyonensis]